MYCTYDIEDVKGKKVVCTRSC